MNAKLLIEIRQTLYARRDALARCGGQNEAIQRAFDRMEEGSFGWCADCSDPIEIPSLVQHPEIPWCLSCQQSRTWLAAGPLH